jgi:Mg-chelatase subunit ChlD
MAQQDQDKIALEITPEYTSYSPGGQEKCWATATMTAPFYEPTSRSEIDLVAVIDRSGSMGGSKINLVKETLVFIIDQRKLHFEE